MQIQVTRTSRRGSKGISGVHTLGTDIVKLFGRIKLVNLGLPSFKLLDHITHYHFVHHDVLNETNKTSFLTK